MPVLREYLCVATRIVVLWSNLIRRVIYSETKEKNREFYFSVVFVVVVVVFLLLFFRLTYLSATMRCAGPSRAFKQHG